MWNAQKADTDVFILDLQRNHAKAIEKLANESEERVKNAVSAERTRQQAEMQR